MGSWIFCKFGGTRLWGDQVLYPRAGERRSAPGSVGTRQTL